MDRYEYGMAHESANDVCVCGERGRVVQIDGAKRPIVLENALWSISCLIVPPVVY